LGEIKKTTYLESDYTTLQNEWIIKIDRDGRQLADVPPILVTPFMCEYAINDDLSNIQFVPADMLNAELLKNTRASELLRTATKIQLLEVMEYFAKIDSGFDCLQYIESEMKDLDLLNKLIAVKYPLRQIIKDPILIKVINEGLLKTLSEFLKEHTYTNGSILSCLDVENKTYEVCLERCVDLKTHKLRQEEIDNLPINDVGFAVCSFCVRLASDNLDWIEPCKTVKVLGELYVQKLYDEIVSMTTCPDYVPIEYANDEMIKHAFTHNYYLKYLADKYKTVEICIYTYKLDPRNENNFPFSQFNETEKTILKYKNQIKGKTLDEIRTECEKIREDLIQYNSFKEDHMKALRAPPSSKLTPAQSRARMDLISLCQRKSIVINIYDFKGCTLSGLEFKLLTQNKTIVKLFSKTKIHNDVEFKLGLNTDPVTFYPNDSCKRGGIYFIEKCNYAKWLDYNFNKMHYFSLITIPNEAQVYIEEDKFKADQIYIIGFRELTAINTLCP
jgi:hypothetical protein